MWAAAVHEELLHNWADLGGPNMLLYLFTLLPATPKPQSTYERVLELVSLGLIVSVTCTIFEPRPFPGLPGPAAGPGGPRIDQQSWDQIYVLSSLRSAAKQRIASRIPARRKTRPTLIGNASSTTVPRPGTAGQTSITALRAVNLD